jgi:hypothetical protein
MNNKFGMDQEIGGKWTLNSNSLYDKNGTAFKVINLMNKDTYDLNVTAYEEIAPIRLTTSFAGKIILIVTD